MIEQGTSEWFELRRGKITGSVMDVVINGSNVAKNTLLEKLSFEYFNPDEPIKENEINSAPINHGKKFEPEAIAQYELEENCDVERPAFIVHANIPYIGCSPDFTRLITPDDIVAVGEVKCPYKHEVHEANVLYGAGKATYKAQIQTELEVIGADVCHFISYCPTYPDHTNRYIKFDVFRDEKYIEDMLKKCEEFWDKLINQERYENKFGGEIPSIF